MSKRKKRAKTNIEMVQLIHRTWDISPVTRVQENKKLYNRKKDKKNFSDYDRGFKCV